MGTVICRKCCLCHTLLRGLPWLVKGGEGQTSQFLLLSLASNTASCAISEDLQGEGSFLGASRAAMRTLSIHLLLLWCCKGFQSVVTML